MGFPIIWTKTASIILLLDRSSSSALCHSVARRYDLANWLSRSNHGDERFDLVLTILMEIWKCVEFNPTFAFTRVTFQRVAIPFD